ncbi:hypothetical protein [Streptomyces sp. NPDC057702]|uniref:hypothetical protein n=1 Tax=unclassified Streptomyces TaxID=2593676 RepID=UPI0036BC26F4
MSIEVENPLSWPYGWVPSGGGVRWTRVGELGWHAVAMPDYLGNRVLAALGEAGGAVIEEDVPARLVWLVEPKDPVARSLHGRWGITVVGDDGSYLFVPGTARARLVWWRVPPEPGRLLTDADQLARAVAWVRAGAGA